VAAPGLRPSARLHKSRHFKLHLTASLSVGAWSVLMTWKTDRHLGLRTARARRSGTWRSPRKPSPDASVCSSGLAPRLKLAPVRRNTKCSIVSLCSAPGPPAVGRKYLLELQMNYRRDVISAKLLVVDHV